MTMKIPQMKLTPFFAAALLCVCASAVGAEHDYYGNLHYPKELVPGVGLEWNEAGVAANLADL